MDKVKLPPVLQIIKDEMERRELSVQQLAEIAGVSFPTIYAMFNGESLPKLDTVEKLASALKLKITVAL